MTRESQAALRARLQRQSVAALGTLHRGEPRVSMVPYALDAAASHLLMHVSALAAHTGDMMMHPRARVTIQADAQPLAAGSQEHEAARAIDCGRFPRAAEIFALPACSPFEINPVSVRHIAGFAQATSLTAESFARALGKA